MSIEQLHTIRAHELARTLKFFPPVGEGICNLLEIGAGTGQQAAQLAALGYAVTAIDLPSSAYAKQRVHPVLDYDGRHVPASDASMDVVFSSNVLEHVVEVDSLLQETARVLTPAGIAIHVLPTTTWRLLTTLTYYPGLLKRFVQILFFKNLVRHDGSSVSRSKVGFFSAFSMLWQKKHGERGNLLTEAWYFSERWWRKTFSEAGFVVQEVVPTGIIYSGSFLFSAVLPISVRKNLAAFLGSSTKIYVLKKQGAHADEN